MRVLSLFSGCMGLDLGLEALGFESAAYVECDPDCLRLIADRRPNVQVIEDVRSVSAELVAALDAEVVAGGFPCQDLSYAGRGAGLDGDRSGLWFEMIRVIRDVRPRLVLVENVPGLLTRGLHVVLHDLATAGYVGRWFAMTAASVGAPHLRERIFIVARRADVSAGIADELAPWFVEWMMGFDHGWTDLDGISRTARLRLLGNAVHVSVGERAGAALLALDRALAGESDD